MSHPADCIYKSRLKIMINMTENRTSVETLINDLANPSTEIRGAAKRELSAYGHEAVDDLAYTIQNVGGIIAREAVDVLGNIIDSRALKILENVLCSHNAVIGQAAVESLLRHPNRKDATRILIDALSKEESHILVQLSIIHALAKIKDNDAVSPLLHLLKTTPSPTVRYMTIEALGRLSDRRATCTIQQYTHDSDDQIRKHARIALRRITSTPR